MNVEQLQQHILTLVGAPSAPRVLLGLSGGPDSVFLFHILRTMHEQKKLVLACAHLNHGWRKRAATDEEFVRELCAEHDIDLFATHAGQLDISVKYNGSREEVGRTLRRHFFEQTLRTWNGNCIALAHHADDQQETFFMRLLRGASLTGLTGMQEQSGPYIRPLLQVYKQELLAHLDAHKFAYALDETNNSDEFLRNRIRNYVLPALTQCDARFNQKFASTLSHLQATERFIEQRTHEAYKHVFMHGSSGNLKTFSSLDPFLQKRAIMQLLQKHHAVFSASDALLNEMLRFLLTPRGGRHQVHSSWALHKKEKEFWLEQT